MAGSGDDITICARKYDRAIHIEWQARLLLADDDLILAYAPPGTTLVHHTRGLRLVQPHACMSVFPRARWWNAMLDFAPDGAPLGIYCNVALPPRGVAPFVVQDRDTALAGLAAQLRRDALGTP